MNERTKLTTRTEDQEIAKSLGWRVSYDPYWNYPSKVGDGHCVRRDGRTDIPCNEALPDFSHMEIGNS